MTDLFDKVFDSGENIEQSIDSVGEAFVAIAVAILTADKEFLDIEQEALFLSMRRMKAFKDYSPEQMEATFSKISTMNQNMDTDDLIDLARDILHPKLRETAFFFATDLAVSDSVLKKEEKGLLNHLQHELNIDPDIAIQIIEVVLIKNRR